MSELFASGRVIDLILGLTAAEAVLLTLWHRRTGRGPAPRPLLLNLLAGACLLLAVRNALCGSAWPWIALPLAGSLLAHLGDLRERWTA
ncbi:MAG: hypothetical protein U1E53_13515 [Dongiaceae bacterium]